MNHLYAITLMADILAAQTENATDLPNLLKEYGNADFMIVRVMPDQRPFCVSEAPEWCDRLLSDGTWQTAQERQQLNLKELTRVMR
jgi:hypothetical protein